MSRTPPRYDLKMMKMTSRKSVVLIFCVVKQTDENKRAIGDKKGTRSLALVLGRKFISTFSIRTIFVYDIGEIIGGTALKLR